MIYAVYGLAALLLIGGILFLVVRSAERRERKPARRMAAGSTADEPGCGIGYDSPPGGDGGGGGGD